MFHLRGVIAASLALAALLAVMHVTTRHEEVAREATATDVGVQEVMPPILVGGPRETIGAQPPSGWQMPPVGYRPMNQHTGSYDITVPESPGDSYEDITAKNKYNEVRNIVYVVMPPPIPEHQMPKKASTEDNEAARSKSHARCFCKPPQPCFCRHPPVPTNATDLSPPAPTPSPEPVESAPPPSPPSSPAPEPVKKRTSEDPMCCFVNGKLLGRPVKDRCDKCPVCASDCEGPCYCKQD